MLVEKSDHRISWYDLDTGRTVGQPVALPDFPHEFVVDAENRYAYVTHYGVKTSSLAGTQGRSVIVIDIAAQKIVHVYDTGEHPRPHGIGLDGSGRLYVLSEYTAHMLVKDNPRSFDAGWDHVVPTGGRKSHLFALTAEGQRAYSLNLDSGDVTVFNPRDAAIAPIALKTGDRPEGRHLTADGKTLYVSNRGSGTIAVIDTASLTITRSFPAAPDCCRIYHDARRNRLMTINYLDCSLSVFDEPSGREIHRHKAAGRTLAMQVDARQDFAFIAVDCEQVQQINLDSFEVILTLKTGREPDVMHVLPDGYF
jgi:YVTN family beta-propeller protein